MEEQEYITLLSGKRIERKVYSQYTNEELKDIIRECRSSAEYLIKGDKHRSSKCIKNYLLKNKLVENKCSVCNIPPEWNNKPLTLQLDHINGDHFDNRIENLRLICPNCHTQTDTYTGRNLREYKKKGML